jgi:hypothetical protein
MFAGVVLFSYVAANAQQTTTTTTPPTTTPTSTNSRVVVTDNLAQPATTAPTEKPATTTTKIGNYSVNVTEGVKGQTMENGKFVTMTKWDGTKWVTKREWVKISTPAPKPNPQ